MAIHYVRSCLVAALVASLLVCGCAPSQSRDAPARAPFAGQSVGPYARPASIIDLGTPVTLAQGARRAAPGLRLPSASQVGDPERVVVWGDEHTPQDRVGLAMRYSGEVELFILPGRTSAEEPDYSQAASSAAAFVDARTRVIEFVTVGSVQAALQRGGVYRRADDTTGTLRAAVSWMDGSTEYILVGDPGRENVERMLAIARSIY